MNVAFPRTSQVVYSDACGDVFEREPRVWDTVVRFLDPATTYGETIEGLEFVGAGMTGDVYRIGDVAIKMSTGLEGVLDSGKPSYAAPADLVLEHRFMTTLRTILGPDSTISVPEHYYAAQQLHGGYVSAQEYVGGRITMERWFQTKGVAPRSSEAMGILRNLRERINSQFAGKKAEALVRWATADATRDGTNLLVDPISFDPENGEITVIDQPDAGLVSSVAARLAVIAYSRELKATPCVQSARFGSQA